jgi:dsRNA-specific ribonuclease
MMSLVPTSKLMNAFERRERILREAWVGDAVLNLYARRRILRETGVVDAARFERMTSNHFLATKGEPSEVEAEIGRLYESEGLDSAFSWIEQQLMPLFERQEEKRMRGLTPRR